MRGYEVIFKFLMISYKTPLESRFSQDPLHCFPYSSSLTLCIPYVFGIYGKVFSRRILAWQFHFHGTWTIFHGICLPEQYHVYIIQHISKLYPSLPLLESSPTGDSSSMLVLHRFREYLGWFLG